MRLPHPGLLLIALGCLLLLLIHGCTPAPLTNQCQAPFKQATLNYSACDAAGYARCEWSGSGPGAPLQVATNCMNQAGLECVEGC